MGQEIDEQAYDPYALHEGAQDIYFGTSEESLNADDNAHVESTTAASTPATTRTEDTPALGVLQRLKQRVSGLRIRLTTRRPATAIAGTEPRKLALPQAFDLQYVRQQMRHFPWQRFLARALVWAVYMTAISAFVSAVATQQVPVASTTLISGALLTVISLIAMVVAWLSLGSFPSTKMAWAMAGLMAPASFNALNFNDSNAKRVFIVLSVFMIAFLLGLFVESRLLRMPNVKPHPVLPSAPLTFGLSLSYCALAPWSTGAFKDSGAAARPLLHWLSPSLVESAPLQYHVAAEWLLAFLAAVFICRGKVLASAPLSWKAPSFILATISIGWAFCIRPLEVFAALIIAGITTTFVSMRRM